MIKNKIDFALIISVKNANPNGDPLNGNRPRTTYDGLGEMSDVCLKRKMRNTLLRKGETILVQSDDNRVDDHRSIKDRYDSNAAMGALKKEKDSDKKAQEACRQWFDVRAFGQVFAGVDDSNMSIAVRGPVSIQSAFSVEPVTASSIQITKSVNLKTDAKDPSQKAGDTMGMKHRVDSGIYVSYGSINRQLAEKTGFTDEDAEKIKYALQNLFVDDESSARPAGSMQVLKVIWWTHKDVVQSSAKVHQSLIVKPDGTYELTKLDGVTVEELEGQ